MIRGTGSVGLALVLWVVGGVLSTLGALCFAELGTTFSQSGEKHVYLREMFGDFAGFIYQWSYLLLSRTGSNAIEAITFVRYVMQPFFQEGCSPPDRAIVMLAVCLICKHASYMYV